MPAPLVGATDVKLTRVSIANEKEGDILAFRRGLSTRAKTPATSVL